MSVHNTGERNIGVIFKEDGAAEVRIWAPLAKEVWLKVNEAITIKLENEAQGYWYGKTHELKPGDRYWFVADGKNLPDPASLSQPGGVHEASQAISLRHEWADNAWKNIPLQDYIIYEVHAGTFTAKGTFKALEQKLDHLSQLGITAIELMPVAQFPGNNNWGYDGVFPFAVQHSYGGAKALQQLVDACHAKGLAVILDVVYNHVGPEGNYLGAYAPYFTSKYKTPWGDAMNFDDAHSDGVRHFFIENALMWLRDFHIDALRLDAVHAIKDFSPVHVLKQLRLEVNKLMKQTSRTHYLIAECDLNDTRFIEPLDEKGYGMDAQWNDEFHHALRVSCGQERQGYYSDFSGIAHLAKAYRDAYVYTGEYSEHRSKKFGTATHDRHGSQFVVFSQNHDQVGNRMLGERTSALLGFEQQKLMAGAVLVSPYLPLLFMGEEYGETNPFLYFVDHSDEELCEAVRKGRKEEFSHFYTGQEVPDPTAADTFKRSKLQWALLDQPQHALLFRYYKTLIALRKKLPELHNGNKHQLETSVDENSQTLIVKRWYDSQHVVCLMNFSPGQQTVKMPECKKSWKNIFDSASPQWNGPGATEDVAECGQPLKLHPHSIVIYTNCYV